ncbi:MAG: hypothetical protein ABEJ59_05750 [Halanaeroarchaeum sp.]
MVDREISDGERIVALLAAELRGRTSPPFDDLAVDEDAAETDAGDAGPGTVAFAVRAGDERLATVVVQPERCYLAFDAGLAAAADAAEDTGLRTRPKATSPPGLLVFVENGAAVKRAVDVLVAAADDAARE